MEEIWARERQAKVKPTNAGLPSVFIPPSSLGGNCKHTLLSSHRKRFPSWKFCLLTFCAVYFKNTFITRAEGTELRLRLPSFWCVFFFWLHLFSACVMRMLSHVPKGLTGKYYGLAQRSINHGEQVKLMPFRQPREGVDVFCLFNFCTCALTLYN